MLQRSFSGSGGNRPTDPRFADTRRPSNPAMEGMPPRMEGEIPPDSSMNQPPPAPLQGQQRQGSFDGGGDGSRMGLYSSLASEAPKRTTSESTLLLPPQPGSRPGSFRSASESHLSPPPLEYRRSQDAGDGPGPPDQPPPPPPQQFRGNRRGSDFRGNDSNYYGPGGINAGGSFDDPGNPRRSPNQRPRPIFGAGVGGPGRGGPGAPFGPGRGGGGFHRQRNDPRFNKLDGPGGMPGPDHVRSLQEDGGYPRKPPPPPGAAGPVDNFGRPRDWQQSPQSSPRNRKPVLTFFQSSPPGDHPQQFHGQSSPRDKIKEPPSGVAAAAAAAAASSSGAPPALQHRRSNEEVPAAAAPAGPPQLTTTALGSNQERGEAVVSLLSELMNNPSLPKQELPNKQLIFRALASIDAKIKVAQKKVDDMQVECDNMEREEQEELEKSKQEGVREAKRQEDERVKQEEERQEKEKHAHEEELQTIMKERKGAFDDELERRMVDLKARVDVAKEECEKKWGDETAQQILAATSDFDAEILKARKELERSSQQSQKSECEVVEMEAELLTKEKQAPETTKTHGPPKCEDIVSRILASNRKRAAESHLIQFTSVSDNDCDEDDITVKLKNARDPKENRTSEDWAMLAKQVTGFADALYTEPSDAPYYDTTEKQNAVLAPLIKEFIANKRQRLEQRWTDLAEEYEYRKRLYYKKRRSKGKQKRSSSVARQSFTKPILESTGGRTSSNPYRRARRGNEVRSEYEQEQIIAELAEKEAMEKKIAFGGSKLPRQVGGLERQLTARYVNTFDAQRVDMLEQEQELALCNVWTDTEKCIFLDRFMQHPKDFRKIASFLRNKTTKDCVSFYYDSKQTVPYKGALREHIMRRKRRGDYPVWDATIEAALSVGAVIEAGPNEEKPLVFHLPDHAYTYQTYNLHPMKRELLDPMVIDEESVRAFEVDQYNDESPRRPGRHRRSARDPLFVLDPEQRKVRTKCLGDFHYWDVDTLTCGVLQLVIPCIFSF